MLAAEHDPDFFAHATPSTHELLEINHSKISLHRAKAGYDYPTIRLPHTFSKLAGLSTRIYQTIYNGSLAFLTVISPTENASKTAKSSVLTWRRSPVRIRPSPSFFLQSHTFEPSIEAFSDTRIMAEKKHNKDKKLHNSHELDLSWQETVDLLPEDEVEGGSEIYYFTDEDGNIHSREFLAEELIDDDVEDLEVSQEGKSRSTTRKQVTAIPQFGCRIRSLCLQG